MVLLKNSRNKRKGKQLKELRTLTEHEIKQALLSLQERKGDCVPSLKDINAELKRLGLRQHAFSTISVTMSRLEDGGHIRHSLEVVA
jgi:hypothetical protein